MSATALAPAKQIIRELKQATEACRVAAEAARATLQKYASKQTVFVVTRAHKDDPFGRCMVLVKPDNHYFRVNKFLLADLESGMTPTELDLDPIEDDDCEI